MSLFTRHTCGPEHTFKQSEAFGNAVSRCQRAYDRFVDATDPSDKQWAKKNHDQTLTDYRNLKLRKEASMAEPCSECLVSCTILDDGHH
jgi:hypothetical protein